MGSCLSRHERLDYQGQKISNFPDEIFKYESVVTELYLDANEITRLPSHLVRLQRLRMLSLSENQIEDLPDEFSFPVLEELHLEDNELESIPFSIRYCTQLQILQLDANRIEELPDDICELKLLRVLDINENGLLCLPDIGKLISLEQLWVRENRLVMVPTSIGKLWKLRKLGLGSNQLVSLPAEIGDLTSLEELWLCDNAIETIPSEIGKLSSMRRLDLSENELQVLPSEIGSLILLEDLWISKNKLEMLPDTLSNLRSLTQLNLEENELVSLPSFADMTQLMELRLSNNNLEALPEGIEDLTQLRVLYADNNYITDLPITIGKLLRCRTLWLNNNRICDLPKEISHMTELKLFNICGNRVHHLPVEYELILDRLQAFWLGQNQSKPRPKFEHVNQDGIMVLTCEYMPQFWDRKGDADSITLGTAAGSLFSVDSNDEEDTFAYVASSNDFRTDSEDETAFAIAKAEAQRERDMREEAAKDVTECADINEVERNERNSMKYIMKPETPDGEDGVHFGSPPFYVHPPMWADVAIEKPQDSPTESSLEDSTLENGLDSANLSVEDISNTMELDGESSEEKLSIRYVSVDKPEIIISCYDDIMNSNNVGTSSGHVTVDKPEVSVEELVSDNEIAKVNIVNDISEDDCAVNSPESVSVSKPEISVTSTVETDVAGISEADNTRISPESVASTVETDVAGIPEDDNTGNSPDSVSVSKPEISVTSTVETDVAGISEDDNTGNSPDSVSVSKPEISVTSTVETDVAGISEDDNTGNSPDSVSVSKPEISVTSTVETDDVAGISEDDVTAKNAALNDVDANGGMPEADTNTSETTVSGKGHAVNKTDSSGEREESTCVTLGKTEGPRILSVQSKSADNGTNHRNVVPETNGNKVPDMSHESTSIPDSIADIDTHEGVTDDVSEVQKSENSLDTVSAVASNHSLSDVEDSVLYGVSKSDPSDTDASEIIVLDLRNEVVDESADVGITLNSQSDSTTSEGVGAIDKFNQKEIALENECATEKKNIDSKESISDDIHVIGVVKIFDASNENIIPAISKSSSSSLAKPTNSDKISEVKPPSSTKASIVAKSSIEQNVVVSKSPPLNHGKKKWMCQGYGIYCSSEVDHSTTGQ